MLAELLESIVSQKFPGVEVIVADDASPDDTKEVTAGFSDRLDNLTYIQQPSNVGMDANFLTSVAAASGEYVWLMGDDDKIEPGGVRRVLNALAQWPDVAGLTLGVIDYDPTMSQQTYIRPMPATQRVEGIGTVFGMLAEHLGFMSALVIKREEWLAASALPETTLFHNYYVQVYLLGKVIEKVGQWGIVKEPCVSFRTGNDQLLEKHGWRKRLEIDVEAYEQLATGLLSKYPQAKRAMRRRIFNTHVLRRIQGAKDSGAGDRGAIKAVLYLGNKYYDMPEFWFNAAPRLLTPSRFAAFIRKGVRQLRKAH